MNPLKETSKPANVIDVVSEDRVDDSDNEDYELAGWVAGAYGGRWIFQPINPATVFPDNTALFIRKSRR
jgi:hypothetical protein